MSFDWKFWAMLAVTVAAAAIPVWIWQVDLNSKALQVNVRSVSELVKGVDSRLELKVSQGDSVLKNPVLSVIEIVNQGGRPILAAEFEGPLVIDLGRQVIVKTASLGKSQPGNLRPAFEIAGSSVSVKPLLINAGDRFEVSILHEGLPIFSADARIAGVQQVSVQLNTSNEKHRRAALIKAVAAIPVFSCYMLLFFAMLTLRMPHYFRFLSLLLASGCGAGAYSLAAPLMQRHELDSTWFAVVGCLLGGLLVYPVYIRLGHLLARGGWPVRIALDRINR